MFKKTSGVMGVFIACVMMLATIASPSAYALEGDEDNQSYVGFKLSSQLVKTDKAQRHYPYLFVMPGRANEKIDAAAFPIKVEDSRFFNPEQTDLEALKNLGYCFNATQKFPSNPRVDPEGNLTARSNYDRATESIVPVATKVRDVENPDTAIKTVIWNGYPYDAAGIKEKLNLTADQFHAVTQSAVWYFSDSFETDGEVKVLQGVSEYRDAIPNMEVALRFLTQSGSLTDTPLEDVTVEKPLDGAQLSAYPSANAGDQSILRAVFVDDEGEIVPPGNNDETTNPSISTVASIDAQKSVELDVVSLVEVVDTIEWKNLPAGRYVAEATYVVNGGDESTVAGSKSFEVTDENAAAGSVPVIVTIPESALSADGQAVKFTVLERVFKANDAGEKTGDVVAEHVDKNSEDQTVSVTVKKPVVPAPSISTVAKVDAQKSVELDSVKAVEVVDTIEWKNLPAGRYVAEATYVVNGGDESTVAGSKSFEVTDENAAQGSVDVELTIPESALSADGQAVKFTVLERVFKANDAGEKTGDVVAEHVDKDSEDQTVSVTVKKPVVPAPKTTHVKFSKVIAGQGDELKGASLKIVKGDKAEGTDIVKEWISSGTPETVVLTEGVYTLVEDQAPLGFLKAEEITFRVLADSEGNTIEILQDGKWVEAKDSTIVMQDERMPLPDTPKPEQPKVVPHDNSALAETGVSIAGMGIAALVLLAGGVLVLGRKKA